ncbi:EF-hand domain-containing protein [Sphingomonas sp.]|jgi:hypothetical protein|uniref:EF-hand domain-containing protein n=1 Tax=Sphingomonas sp. TaxID=28214 RepID=UPI002D801C2F|nr:EF-hand domain-containing protein [Sphingomonas sp.]HEU0043487.1 EF-hand domain-containing protein [Sphingomonas sp.]
MILLLLALVGVQADPAEVRVLGPGKANAQTPATLMIEPAGMFVATCDADGDGRTGRTELDGCIARSFVVIDRPGTGSLGYLAYADWQSRWLGDQAALPSPYEVDRDGDGRVALAELQAQFSRLFSRYDRDGDGQVTRAEVLTFRAAPLGGRPVRRGPPPGTQRVPGGSPDPAPQP